MIESAALLALIVLAGLTLFQIALIAGAPWGRFAWGGQHQVLPTRLRVGSVVSIGLYTIFALLILQASGLAALGLPDGFVRSGMWFVAIYSCIGVLMNAVSRSKSERALMTPVAACLALAYVYVTIGT